MQCLQRHASNVVSARPLALVPARVAAKHAFSYGPQQKRSHPGVVARVALSPSLTDCGEPLVEGMDQPAIDDLRRLPAGYHWYETMLILNPEMDDLARDKELAKFEAYINKEQCINIQAVLRSRTRLAYPMQKHVDGIYILYTFAARKQTARVIQRFLSNPESGSEGNLLRHITFRKS